MQNSWTLDDDEYFGSTQDPPAKAIHVLVKLPPLESPDATQASQVNWTVAPEPCHRLTVRAEDRLIELPPSYIDGTGIGDSARPLILYRRAPLIEQWNEMNRCSIQTYALLWVVGPPGTGKSCAALAFAWSLHSSHWDVIWIHYSRHFENFNCVWLHGTTKATCVIGKETVERDLAAILDSTSATTRTIVFLDGYVKTFQAAESARLKCKRWHQRDVINHRFVCVCSMVSLGKDFRVEDYPSIPINADFDVEMVSSDEDAVQDDLAMEQVDGQMMFELESWTFQEYTEAIKLDLFFQTVVSIFPGYQQRQSAEDEAMERMKLLEEKFFVAGGSARLMFEYTTTKAIRSLNKAIRATPNIEPYLLGYVGDSSRGCVDRLLAWYTSDGVDIDIRLVSEYVVRRYANIMGPRLLQKFAKACRVNPSMDGHILEAWFFAELHHNGIVWSYYENSKLYQQKWMQSSITFFDPDVYRIRVSFNDPKWVAPMKWNQGGYDAVYVNKVENLVRFVQVARAEIHTFLSNCFVALLNKLAAGILNQVALVEMCFVVPMERLKAFKLPVSKEAFESNVVKLARSEPRDQTFHGCRANVMVIGVEYEISG